MTAESGSPWLAHRLGFLSFASIRAGLAMTPMGPLSPAGVVLVLVSIGLVACGTPPAQEDAAVESIGEWSISRAGPAAREGGDIEAADGRAIELRHRASQHAWLGELLGRLHPAWSRVGRPSVVVGPEGGLSAEEVSELRDRGALVASLGPSIMRTETAAVVGLSLVIAALQEAGAGDA